MSNNQGPYDTSLYGFQRGDVDYLVDHGGGCLWNDPGLGKTRTAIVAAKKFGPPILVICPNSLKQWWRREIRTLYPNASLSVAKAGGRFGPKGLHTLPNNGQPIPCWTIVHYTGARMNRDHLMRVPWSVVILDEAHYIKNRKAQRTKAIQQLTPGYAYRIALTATPFGNNPADIWSQLRWIAPYVDGLKSYWRFFNTFVEYDWEVRGEHRYRKIKGGRHLKLLATVMSAYGVRHSKKEVAPQLPPITDTYVPLEMAPDQEWTYNQLRKKSAIEIEFPADADGPAYRLIIPNALARLLRMEQWLSHPWKYKAGVKGAKLEWLLQWLDSYKQQAVIAVRFKETAYHIAELLRDKEWGNDSDALALTFRGADGREYAGASETGVGLTPGRASPPPGGATPNRVRGKTLCGHPVTGDVSTGARDSIIQGWKEGKHQLLIGTIDTIGVGLSFENAHAMVCYDQLYSAIKMDQVRQRIHRITTDHPVEVFYPYIKGTTNEIIQNSFLHRWKQIELVRQFIEHIQGPHSDGGHS